MKTSTSILTLASLLTSSFAAPLTTHTLLSTVRPITWSVTNYTSGCSPGGCTYSFNIATNRPGSGQYPEPEFSTFCEGTDVQEALKACEDPSVTTNAVPGVSNMTIVVNHRWEQALGGAGGGVGIFTLVGNHTVVDGGVEPLCFDVPQLEEYAVA